MAGKREISPHEHSLVREARQLFELPYGKLELLDGRQNIVVRVGEAVIRIAPESKLAEERTHKLVNVTPILTREFAPVTPLLRNYFVKVGNGLYATAWKFCPPDPQKETLEALGETTRKLHEVEIPQAGEGYRIPAWDSLSDLRKRLKAAVDLGTISTKDADYITDSANKVDNELYLLRDKFHPVVVHADGHPGNLVGGLLADLDALSWGPRGVDIATCFTREQRFHLNEFEEFSKGYNKGYDNDKDLSDEIGFDVLVRARELKNVGACLSRLDEPAVMAEFQKRLNSIRGNDFTVKWEKLPERQSTTSNSAGIYVPHSYAAAAQRTGTLSSGKGGLRI